MHGCICTGDALAYENGITGIFDFKIMLYLKSMINATPVYEVHGLV